MLDVPFLFLFSKEKKAQAKRIKERWKVQTSVSKLALKADGRIQLFHVELWHGRETPSRVFEIEKQMGRQQDSKPRWVLGNLASIQICFFGNSPFFSPAAVAPLRPSYTRAAICNAVQFGNCYTLHESYSHYSYPAFR